MTPPTDTVEVAARSGADAHLAALIGTAFADLYQSQVTPAVLAIVRRRNAEWDDPLACASHDFLDANMVMAEAFTRVVGREPKGSWETHFDPASGRHIADDPEEERQALADMALWNAAWDFTKQHRLTARD